MNLFQTSPDKIYDLTLLGRIAIDFNPVDYYQTLGESTTYKKYVGGSPANIAVGLSRLGKKCGFIGTVSDDQFGDYVVNFFNQENIDTSQISKALHGEKIGLTFTEILNENESSILMYRQSIADLSLEPSDVSEEYIKNSKALLISGTALAESPSREAMLKAMFIALRNDVPIVFDIDYRAYNWRNHDEISIYYSIVAQNSTIIMGSREEYDLTHKLLTERLSDKEIANFWFQHKAKIVVIKHGKAGSTAYTCNGEDYSIKPFPVKALKSFGGGDGYASSFLYGLLEGWDIPDCLELASASASLLVKAHGCSEFMPTVAEVQAFIKECKAEYGDMVARK